MGDPQDRDRTDGPAPSEPPTPSVASPGDDDQGKRPKRARRNSLTRIACMRCRQKKSKCDGRRQTCERCEKHGVECVYEVAQEGMTRMQNLQQQLDIRTADYSNLQTMFNTLQQGTDQEATTLLARLRLGDSIHDLLDLPGPSPTSASPSTMPDGSSQSQSQRLSQYPSYTQSWSDDQSAEPGTWTPWQDVADVSMSQSTEPRRDDSRSAGGRPPGDLVDIGDSRESYYQHGGRDGLRALEQHTSAGSMNWQRQVEIGPPDVPLSFNQQLAEEEPDSSVQGRSNQPARDRGSGQQPPPRKRRS